MEKVEKIERWINTADVNHFPSIEKRFDGIEQKMAYYSGIIVVAFTLIELILRYFKL